MAFGLFLTVANAMAADCVHGVAYSTPGALTCTIPAGVTTVKVVAEGAGGGGGTVPLEEAAPKFSQHSR